MENDDDVVVTKKKMHSFMENSELLGVICAVIVGLVTLVIVFSLWRYRRSSRRGILFMGLCESGKTLLFSQLLYNQQSTTLTSMKENIGNYNVNRKHLRVIDIPGHERVRGKFFEKYKSLTKGIVCVVDSVTFQKEIRDVAELLYTILTDPVMASIYPQLLILCNKQDMTMAKGSKVIKSQLEKELNMLRVTKSSQLSSTGGSANNNIYLGHIGKDFEFSQCAPINIVFSESSCVEPAALDGIRKWMNSLA